MGKALSCRKFLCFIAISAMLFTAGCLQERLVYPEIVSYNAFKMPDQWADKFISSIKVYDNLPDTAPSKEPVWVINATEKIKANKIIFAAGMLPYGFEQTVPKLPDKFVPIDGQKYYIKVEIEPVENHIFSVLKQWTASSIPKINEQGIEPYVHMATKMEFPMYVGLFKRGEVSVYDGIGLDISASYYQPVLKGVTTVYIYPAIDSANNPKDIRAHFEEIKETIKLHYYKSSLISSGDCQIKQNNETFQGLHAAFSMVRESSGTDVEVFSDLYLFKYGSWFIKYRFTYPRESRREMELEIEQFLKSLVWPDLNNIFELNSQKSY